MGLVFYGIHKTIAMQMKAKYGLTHFVETGTWMGDSALWARKEAGFTHVETIEITPSLFRGVHRNLENNGIIAHFGNSRTVLRQILTFIDSFPTLFWLDAHWTGEKDYFDPNGWCSALDEVNVINEVFKAPHVILIDDYRMFPDEPTGWPSKNQIIVALQNEGQRCVITTDDIFIGEPC